MALEVVVEDGEEKLGGVWDYREDKEGIYYDIENSDQSRKDAFLKKKNFIDSEIDQRNEERKNVLGFIVEPI